MEFIKNLIPFYLFVAFAVFIFAGKTRWFGGLEKKEQVKYALGWPYYLPKYLWLRYQDRK